MPAIAQIPFPVGTIARCYVCSACYPLECDVVGKREDRHYRSTQEIQLPCGHQGHPLIYLSDNLETFSPADIRPPKSEPSPSNMISLYRKMLILAYGPEVAIASIIRYDEQQRQYLFGRAVVSGGSVLPPSPKNIRWYSWRALAESIRSQLERLNHGQA